MDTIVIYVAKDFSTTPGPRYKKEGEFSGEEFRENILDKKFQEVLANESKLIINLDGTFGYGTSFLEESFGGLARKYKDKDILKHIEFVSEEEPYLIDEIKSYINDVLKDNKNEK